MTKQTFTMSAHALRYLAEASLAAIDKTEWSTPILLAARFEVEKSRVRVLATDRYRVHEAFAETKKPAQPHELLIHHTELRWIVTTMTQNRKASGERNPGAKLTRHQVAEIRRSLDAGETQMSIARRFGVSQSSISRIARGTHWKEVSHP